MSISRRRFLRTAQALCAAPLLAAPAAWAASDARGNARRASARDLRVDDVAGLALVCGAGCNVVALGGPEGALLVDGGLAVNAPLLLRTVANHLKTPRIHTLVNTHWHPEQTGSNELAGKSGAVLVAHEVTRLALGQPNRSAVFEGHYGPLPETARPRQTTYNTGSLEFAGETVSYRYLPAAHTNGDLAVHFPRRNVLVAGGPVSASAWPVIDYLNGGFIHGFMRSYEILAEMVKPDTRIVAADGPVLTGADLLRHQAMYQELFRQFFVFFNKGFGPQDAIAAEPLKAHVAELGDPAKFLAAAYRSLQLASVPH